MAGRADADQRLPGRDEFADDLRFVFGSTRRRTLMRATSASLSTSNPGRRFRTFGSAKTNETRKSLSRCFLANWGNVVSVLYSSSAVTMTRWGRIGRPGCAGSAGWVPGTKARPMSRAKVVGRVGVRIVVFLGMPQARFAH